MLQSSRWPGSVILARQLRPLITGTQTMASSAHKRTKHKVASCFGILHREDTSERQILKWNRISHSGVEESSLLRCYIMSTGKLSWTFRRVVCLILRSDEGASFLRNCGNCSNADGLQYPRRLKYSV